MACIFTITAVLISLMLIFIRLLYVLYRTGKPLKTRGSAGLTLPPLSTLVILGSGGHTAEMLNLLSVLQKDRFSPRFYIAAATDNMSLQKAQLLEETEDKVEEISRSQFMQIYRSREVGQSYMTCFDYFDCYRSCALANAKYQTSSDSMQWAWDLCSTLCDCILI